MTAALACAAIIINALYFYGKRLKRQILSLKLERSRLESHASFDVENRLRICAYLERARRLLADPRKRCKQGFKSGRNPYLEWEAERLQLEAEIQEASGEKQ